jgi:hypothetical protein
MAGVVVSLAAGFFLAYVGLPATSPLSLLTGLLCGSILARSMVGGKGPRGWVTAFGAVLFAEFLLGLAMIGLIAVFGSR